MTVRGRQSGFTLLELVLALVIFGMIAAVVYSAFYFGHRAVTSGERSADENQRMRLAEEMLGRQVRSAVYYFAHHDDEENIPFFLGAADGMMFVTSAPQSRGGTGLAAVTYRLVEGKLVVEERVNFTPKDLYDVPSDAPVQRAVLLEGFTSFRFEYMAAEERDLGWVDKWDARDEDDLPGLVRVTVDGLSYFGGAPWIREIPLLTRAAGWGTNDFQEPPDDETEDDESGVMTTTGAQDDPGNPLDDPEDDPEDDP
ncbi:MAG: prepilin-type N-terminal cleavage/methylation domain-containing protein [Deltaproteobacteria bacterium]|nr:prepilin-type N-terminal cleavage/methylation domain-containing protein [Deltaproteobacteria bacterium]